MYRRPPRRPTGGRAGDAHEHRAGPHAGEQRRGVDVPRRRRRAGRGARAPRIAQPHPEVERVARDAERGAARDAVAPPHAHVAHAAVGDAHVGCADPGRRGDAQHDPRAARDAAGERDLAVVDRDDGRAGRRGPREPAVARAPAARRGSERVDEARRGVARRRVERREPRARRG